MAFDPEIHAFDKKSGFILDKRTGALAGHQPIPLPAVPAGVEFPKWVPVHESHVVRKMVQGAPDHIAVPAWPEFHVDRVSGMVTVLVADAGSEARAMSAPAPAVSPEPIVEAAPVAASLAEPAV